MMQQAAPEDYIVATGKTHSVQNFVEAAFAAVTLDWQQHVQHAQSFDRPTEPAHLVGSPEKIARALGWRAEITFADLVREMVDAELAAIDAAGKR